VSVPVAVWDVRDPAWQDGWQPRLAWIRDHGLPAAQIYRIEFYQSGDGPRARIFCYALDSDDRKYWAAGHTRDPHDHSGCGPAREEPRLIVLPDLPPAGLRTG
jgi:hypothetical protein